VLIFLNNDFDSIIAAKMKTIMYSIFLKRLLDDRYFASELGTRRTWEDAI